MKLWQQIRKNEELKNLEMEGFGIGSLKGKTMNVSLNELMKSLRKQYLDVFEAYAKNDKEAIKRCLADLRNLAGCCFLNIQQENARNERD